MNTSPILHLREELTRVIDTQDFSSSNASFALPYSRRAIDESIALNEKLDDYDIMLLVGIGGSNLGTIAVSDALRDTLPGKKKIYFFDTPDAHDVERQWKGINQELKSGKKALLTVISKSGGTTETIALASELYSRLERDHQGSYEVVTISDKDSKLDQLSKNEGWHQLHLPKQVGGRYSVLSSVGLFPLVFLSVDTEGLMSGARSALEKFRINPLEHEATIVARKLFENYPERNIFEHWFFSKKLENLGKWYRQLLAESVGKIRSDGTTVGITPSNALGTIDLHSIAQLDLAHTRDRVIALVREKNPEHIMITPTPFTTLLPHLEGKQFDQIMDAALGGFREALESKNVPIHTYEIDTSSAYDVGYWLETKMIEVALLGHMFDINPFDQPNVEDYKRLMEPRLKN